MKFKILLLLIPFLLFAYTSDRALKVYQDKHATESKIALVIGNNDYPGAAKLNNAENDAKDIAYILKNKLGFQVIDGYNLDEDEMYDKIDVFLHKIKRDKGVGLVYYAGHGVEIDGVNYLVPIGEYKSKKNIKRHAINLNDLLTDISSNQKSRMNIVILDACRNNPYEGSRGESGGLAKVSNEKAQGTFIAYSASSGKTADDNAEGKNGIYTYFLKQHIQTPNLRLIDIFEKVRIDVEKATNGRQLPEELNKKRGKFYFKVDTLGVNMQKQNNSIEHEKEKIFWKVVKEENTKEYYELYLKTYPYGLFVDIARNKISKETPYKIDKYTGLVWYQDNNDRITDYNAVKYCRNLKIKGYENWRLPEKIELEGAFVNGLVYHPVEDFFWTYGLKKHLIKPKYLTRGLEFKKKKMVFDGSKAKVVCVHDERRIALVIGNSYYKSLTKINGAIQDSRQMNKELKSLGYKVNYIENGNLVQITDAINAYTKELKKGGVGFIYYSGHGFTINKKTYIVPIDFAEKDIYNIKSNSYSFELIDLKLLVSKIKKANNRLNIIVYDADTYNPFSTINNNDSLYEGEKNVLIAYTAALNSHVIDNEVNYGFFVQSFINLNKFDNITISELFSDIQYNIKKQSKGKQLSIFYNNLEIRQVPIRFGIR